VILRARPVLAFADDAAVTAFAPVNDVVMGGVSEGALVRAGPGVAAFTGRVSFERGGGFASVRAPLPPRALAGAVGLRLRVRGDDRRYRLQCRTGLTSGATAYGAPFRPGLAWTDVDLLFDDFVLRSFGRAIDGPPFTGAEVVSLGLLVGEGQEGPFRLELERIDALEPAA
jgi:hypothetical protein